MVGMLEDFFSRLIPFPDGLHPKRGTNEFRRIRALTAMLVTTTFATYFWLLIIVWLHYVSGVDLYLNLIVGIIVVSILSFETWCFYRFSNVRISAMFMTVTFFLIIFGLVFFSGGYDSALKPLLLTCPVLSFRIGGKQEGISNSILVGIVGLFFIFFHAIDVSFENMFSNETEIFFSTVAWITSLLLIATSLMAYDMDE